MKTNMKKMMIFMETNFKTCLCIIFVLLQLIMSLVLPHGDDFLYLNYFENIKNWHYKGYSWVNDCVLLPRGFWRPWEDLLGFFNAATPGSFPYLNHFIIVSLHMICGYLTYELCRKIKLSKIVAIFGCFFFLFCTNSMGGLISVDSIAQVLVTFFGLLSVKFYNCNSKYHIFLWLLFGILAFFAKESGFVWILVGPIFNEIVEQKNESNAFCFRNVKWGRMFAYIGIAIIPIILYFVLYMSLCPEEFSGLAEASKETTKNSAISLSSMTSAESSTAVHGINPADIIKSAFVLYGASLLPMDTSAVYFHNYFLLVVTSIFALLGLFFIFKGFITVTKKEWQLVIGLILIVLWTSSVSLLTRAGEISPHPSNAIMAILFACIINEIKLNKYTLLSIVSFCVATLITDAHKYYLCYSAGLVTTEMGKDTIAKTNGNPEKVLCITVENDKKDGTFVPNVSYDYQAGSTAIRLYNYRYPKYRDVKVLKENEVDLNAKIDSIVSANLQKDYDCIWIQKFGKVEVLNLK